jgi:hypothetical protein
MRTQILKGIATASVLGAMLVGSGNAQAADVKAKVPFSFTVNKKVLPPGPYSISSTGNTALMIVGPTKGALTVSQRLESAGASGPKLVFHRYGSEYILREVWTGGGTGRLLPEPRRERELASRAGTNGTSTAAFERVEIPLL